MVIVLPPLFPIINQPVGGEDEEREHEKSIEAMKFGEGGGSRMGMESMREGESLSQ